MRALQKSELFGTWQFVGGGEITGCGFRLNADGTGEFLEPDTIGMGTRKHLQPTGTPSPGMLKATSFRLQRME